MELIQIFNHAFFPNLAIPTDTAIRLNGDVDLASFFSDYNAFYQEVTRPVVHWLNRPYALPEYLTLADWQALGKDLNSAIYDPTDPEVAANINLYQLRDLNGVPPLIVAPCCARFWFCTGNPGGDPCSDPSMAVFSQHLASQQGPSGWSDLIIYEETGALMQSRTFCGPCGRDGLLADFPTAYP